MPPNNHNTDGTTVFDVAIGAEASRAVAWAKYYEALERLEKMLQLNLLMEERLAELVILVSESEALSLFESEGELVVKARSILGSLVLRPRGKAALGRVRDRRAATKVNT